MNIYIYISTYIYIYIHLHFTVVEVVSDQSRARTHALKAATKTLRRTATNHSQL